MSGAKKVAVVGAGLAGLSAACELAMRGYRVRVFEARGRLGGATFSFRRGELTVDNGQHVLLRCYTEYLAFLRTVGSYRYIRMQPKFDIPVVIDNGKFARLSRTLGLPAPLHLGPSLANYRALALPDRMRVMRAALALRFLDPADSALDRRSFGEWLAEHGQNARTRKAVWDLLTVAALNTDSSNASLLLAAKVFRTALLDRADAADIGIPLVGLQELHGDPAANFLRRHGAEIHPHTPVRTIRRAANRFDGFDGFDGFDIVTDDDTISVDAVVVATNSPSVESICPPEIFAGRRIRELGAAPIVNVHACYSRRIISEPFLAVLDSPVQWIFDRTAIAGSASGQYLAVSLSSADDWIDTPTAALREIFSIEFERLFPLAHKENLVDFFVTRERFATFRQAPGSAAHRPPARTAVPGIALAGAWTDTGWPDTMEGAVRSGKAAAEVIVAHCAANSAGANSGAGNSPDKTRAVTNSAMNAMNR